MEKLLYIRGYTNYPLSKHNKKALLINKSGRLIKRKTPDPIVFSPEKGLKTLKYQTPEIQGKRDNIIYIRNIATFKRV